MRVRARFFVRSGAVAVAAILAVGSAGALAAGRTVYFGSPPTTVGSFPGEVRIQTPLVAGQLTAFRLVLENKGTSTLTQVAIAGGSAIATSDASTLLMPFLTSGASFLMPLPVGPASCSLTASNDGFFCTFPNLAKGDKAELQVAVRAQPSEGTLRVVTAAQVKENRNDNGANPDTFYAVGEATAVFDTGDSVSTFLPSGQTADVLTDVLTRAQPTETNFQQTTVRVPGVANGQPVGITEIRDEQNAYCAAGLTCFGQAAIVSVNYGSVVTPYLEWRMEWDATLLPKGYNERKGGVVHVEDTGKKVVIPVKTACTATVATNCVVSYGYSPDKLTYSIVFRTPSNGGTRGH